MTLKKVYKLEYFRASQLYMMWDTFQKHVIESSFPQEVTSENINQVIRDMDSLNGRIAKILKELFTIASQIEGQQIEDNMATLCWKQKRKEEERGY